MKFPIGIQTFKNLREHNDYYYVDKTQKIIELIQAGKFIFLSRPRRFGKSLTLDTIAELFSANKSLFKGLYAEEHWNWDEKYPVIRVSFGTNVTFNDESLVSIINEKLEELEDDNQLEHMSHLSISARFKHLLKHIYQKTGKQAVILIDEYDKPILDNIANLEQALLIRNRLRDFYGVLKESESYLRFVMLTGVSKFSKINLFSGLNNLYDVTLLAQFSSLCGYTQQELETVFKYELSDVNLAELKEWYNGYNWTGESVYNPFDVLLFLDDKSRLYKSHWFETGSPTFLIDKLINDNINIGTLSENFSDELQLSKFDVDDISPTALMFQTGYLTIDSVVNTFNGVGYKLKFPNKEVQQSLNAILLRRYLHNLPTLETGMSFRSHLYDALVNNDIERMKIVVTAFFAGIPHDWHRNNKIANYEGYWASVFYAYFASLGFPIITEDATNKGNIDMTLIVKDHIYIFEFKVVGKKIKEDPIGVALSQIIDRDYELKYQGEGKVIHKIGVEFNKDNRDVVFDISE